MPSKTLVATTCGGPSPQGLHRWAVARLPGCGPARARALAERGVRTVWDLLHTAPRLAPAPPPWHEAGPLPAGSLVRLRARLLTVRPVFHRGRGLIGRLALADGTEVGVQFFQAGWLRRLLVPDTWYAWEGRCDASGTRLLHPRFTALPAAPVGPPPADDGLRVTYDADDAVGERTWKALVAAALGEPLRHAADPLGMLPATAYQELLRTLHQPADAASFAQARSALAERELAALAWRLQEATQPAERGQTRPPWDPARTVQALAQLPWPLTPGQQRVWSDIVADLEAPVPMCRLLQGDVGSGKTAIAFLACAIATADAGQAIVLAPTTVLADQLHRTLAPWLERLGLRTACLTGATAPAQARAVRAAVREGTIAVVIGTHALLGETVQPRHLALVVIDESHRFGVAQRMLALAKPANGAAGRPDVLLLSATPIPRSLALTLYGDLPISVLQGLPPGRAPVATTFVRFSRGADAVARVREEVARGERVFVVCARREEDDAQRDCMRVHGGLREAGVPAVLAHGQLEPAALAQAIAAFAGGRVPVLVATSVIEVGIDVPTATLMVVVDSERFGLASLHQLRGRVGRGATAARCLLGHAGATPPERLALLTSCHDGLAIADADLAARGAGDLLGMLQAGQTRLRLADLAQDLDRLRHAHAWARAARGAGAPLPEALAALLHDGGADPAAG